MDIGVISVRYARALIKAALGMKLEDQVYQEMQTLYTLQFMAASYITLYRKQKNIIRGKLITATAVDAQTEDKMRKMVEQRTQGTVEFKTEVNPDIIGGFILEYDTYRMDASVKTKLNAILTQLKK